MWSESYRVQNHISQDEITTMVPLWVLILAVAGVDAIDGLNACATEFILRLFSVLCVVKTESQQQFEDLIQTMKRSSFLDASADEQLSRSLQTQLQGPKGDAGPQGVPGLTGPSVCSAAPTTIQNRIVVVLGQAGACRPSRPTGCCWT